MKIAAVYVPRIARALFVADLLIIIVTMLSALMVFDQMGRTWPGSESIPGAIYSVLLIACLAAFILISNFSMGMYQRRYTFGRKLAKSLLASSLISLVSMLVVDNVFLENSVTFSEVLVITISMFAGFAIMRPIMRPIFENYVQKRRVALIGSPNMAEQFRWAVDSVTPSDAVLVDHYPFDRTSNSENLPEMVEIARQNPNIDEIFVEMSAPDLVRYGFGEARAELNSTRSFFDRYSRWTDNELVHAKEAQELVTKGHASFWAKRVIETVVSLIVFLFFLPLFIGAIIAIKLDDGGSLFYGQTRVGKNGKHFRVLKFRSMVENAERDGAPQWAKVGDNRVTRVGAFLRKSRIDELPQLWNIIRGDMALVGPRPERPEFVEKLARDIPNFELRHVVRPGLTGWAQISYPYGASLEDARWKTRLDLYYINNWTIWFDLAIIAQTVRVVLLAEGSR